MRTASASAGGGIAKVSENAQDVGIVQATLFVESDPSLEADKERSVEMVFKSPDAVSNGSRGDVELVGGADKALVPGSGLEKAETIKRR